MSSTKLKVHKILHSPSEEDQAMATGNAYNYLKFERVVFEICEQTDK